MKVFISGASGFIGKAIVKKLVEEGGFDITVLLMPEEPEQVMNDMPVRIVRGDITEAETLSGLMKDHDGVIHLAGAVGYGQSMDNCVRVNRDGTASVAAEAIRSGSRRFIHFSSVSVYGRVSGVPIDESFPLKKIGDPYGDTKIDAEHILADLSNQNKLDLTIIRPTVIYGPGDTMFLPKLLENVESGHARLIGTGLNSVDLIHVADVADFVLLILKKPKSIGQIYNLTHPSNPTWQEFMSMITRELGLPKIEKRLPYFPALVIAGMMEFLARVRGKASRLTRYSVRVVGRQYHYMTDKFQQELGYYPKIDLQSGMKAELEKMRYVKNGQP
jgi:nucleoside-diphosphate-sugar epimerase